MAGKCRCQGFSSCRGGRRRGGRRGNRSFRRELANGMVVVDAVLVSQIEVSVFSRDEAVGAGP